MAELEGADSDDEDEDGDDEDDDTWTTGQGGSTKENQSEGMDDDEINPFLNDFTKEDPWAKKQQHIRRVRSERPKREDNPVRDVEFESATFQDQSCDFPKPQSIGHLLPKKKRINGQLPSQASVSLSTPLFMDVINLWLHRLANHR